MKKSTIFLCLFLWLPLAQATEINNEVLTKYWAKGREAFNKEQWIEAIKYFFVYRELSALSNATEEQLFEVDGYIKAAEENVSINPKRYEAYRHDRKHGNGSILMEKERSR